MCSCIKYDIYISYPNGQMVFHFFKIVLHFPLYNNMYADTFKGKMLKENDNYVIKLFTLTSSSISDILRSIARLSRFSNSDSEFLVV